MTYSSTLLIHESEWRIILSCAVLQSTFMKAFFVRASKETEMWENNFLLYKFHPFQPSANYVTNSYVRFYGRKRLCKKLFSSQQEFYLIPENSSRTECRHICKTVHPQHTLKVMIYSVRPSKMKKKRGEQAIKQTRPVRRIIHHRHRYFNILPRRWKSK